MAIRTKTIKYQQTKSDGCRFTFAFSIDTTDNSITSINCTDDVYHVTAIAQKEDTYFVIPDTLYLTDLSYYPADIFIKFIHEILGVSSYHFFGSSADIDNIVRTTTLDTMRTPHLTIPALDRHDDSWYDA